MAEVIETGLSSLQQVATARTYKQEKIETNLVNRGFKLGPVDGGWETDSNGVSVAGRKFGLENIGIGGTVIPLDVYRGDKGESNVKRLKAFVEIIDKKTALSRLDRQSVLDPTEKYVYERVINNNYEGMIVIRVGDGSRLAGYSHLAVRDVDGVKVLEGPQQPFFDYDVYLDQDPVAGGSFPKRKKAEGFGSMNSDTNALEVSAGYRGLGVADLMINLGNLAGAQVFGAEERWFTTDATNAGQGSYYVNEMGASMESRQTFKGEMTVPVMKISSKLDDYDMRPYVQT